MLAPILEKPLITCRNRRRLRGERFAASHFELAGVKEPT